MAWQAWHAIQQPLQHVPLQQHPQPSAPLALEEWGYASQAIAACSQAKCGEGEQVLLCQVVEQLQAQRQLVVVAQLQDVRQRQLVSQLQEVVEARTLEVARLEASELLSA